MFQKGNKLRKGLKPSNSFKKGEPSWNKGKKGTFKHTTEWKEKMSKMKSGKKPYQMNDEIKRKISNSLKGKYFPPKNPTEKSRKISLALTGKKMSEERRLKMIAGLTGRPNLKARKLVHKIDESKVWRSRIEYRLWREAVFARDNWTCQNCGQRGKELHPHHTQNFSQFQELRFAIDNGITLCKNCHKLFHKLYGRTDNNKEQLNSFLKNIII
jgi:hypothetical protein